MTKKKAEIRMKISVIETDDGNQLEVSVDLDGTNHEVMDIAEIAQHAQVMGEVGVERVLLHILNEEKPVEMNFNGLVQ